MEKTKYEQVLEELEIIKKQADQCLKVKNNDSDAEMFGEVFKKLREANSTFSGSFAGRIGCPPGTYDCSEYCSATPCFAGQQMVPYPND